MKLILRFVKVTTFPDPEHIYPEGWGEYSGSEFRWGRYFAIHNDDGTTTLLREPTWRERTFPIGRMFWEVTVPIMRIPPTPTPASPSP